MEEPYTDIGGIKWLQVRGRSSITIIADDPPGRTRAVHQVVSAAPHKFRDVQGLDGAQIRGPAHHRQPDRQPLKSTKIQEK